MIYHQRLIDVFLYNKLSYTSFKWLNVEILLFLDKETIMFPCRNCLQHPKIPVGSTKKLSIIHSRRERNLPYKFSSGISKKPFYLLVMKNSWRTGEYRIKFAVLLGKVGYRLREDGRVSTQLANLCRHPPLSVTYFLFTSPLEISCFYRK